MNRTEITALSPPTAIAAISRYVNRFAIFKGPKLERYLFGLALARHVAADDENLRRLLRWVAGYEGSRSRLFVEGKPAFPQHEADEALQQLLLTVRTARRKIAGIHLWRVPSPLQHKAPLMTLYYWVPEDWPRRSESLLFEAHSKEAAARG